MVNTFNTGISLENIFNIGVTLTSFPPLFFLLNFLSFFDQIGLTSLTFSILSLSSRPLLADRELRHGVNGRELLHEVEFRVGLMNGVQKTAVDFSCFQFLELTKAQQLCFLLLI